MSRKNRIRNTGAANRTCAAGLSDDSILRATACKSLLQQYRALSGPRALKAGRPNRATTGDSESGSWYLELLAEKGEGTFGRSPRDFGIIGAAIGPQL